MKGKIMKDTTLIWVTNGWTKPTGSSYKTIVAADPKPTPEHTVEELRKDGLHGWYVEKWEYDEKQEYYKNLEKSKEKQL